MKSTLSVFAAVMAIAVIVVFAAFQTAETYGQICAENHPEGSQAWNSCVYSTVQTVHREAMR